MIQSAEAKRAFPTELGRSKIHRKHGILDEDKFIRDVLLFSFSSMNVFILDTFKICPQLRFRNESQAIKIKGNDY